VSSYLIRVKDIVDIVTKHQVVQLRIVLLQIRVTTKIFQIYAEIQQINIKETKQRLNIARTLHMILNTAPTLNGAQMLKRMTFPKQKQVKNLFHLSRNKVSTKYIIKLIIGINLTIMKLEFFKVQTQL